MKTRASRIFARILRVARALRASRALPVAFALAFLPAFVGAIRAPVARADDGACYEAIRAHFLAVDPEAARKLFNLQAKLTLHRLARAHLLAAKGKDAEGKIPSLEKSILDALSRIEAGKKDGKFAAAEQAFRNAPLSRRALADVLSALRATLEAQQGDDTPFALRLEDVRLLSILAEVEDSPTNREGRFARDPRNPKSVLNLLKVIDSSYRDLAPARIDRELALVAKEMERIERSLDSYAEAMKKIVAENPACAAAIACPDCAARGTDGVRKSQALELLLRAMNTDLKENDYRGVRYGEVWLRTTGAPARPAAPKAAVGQPPGAEPATATPPPSPAISPTAFPKAPPPAASEFRLNASAIQAAYEARKSTTRVQRLEKGQQDAMARAIQATNAVRACLTRAYGKAAPAAVAAYALYRSESARAFIHYGSVRNVVRGRLRLPANPYAAPTGLAGCPEAEKLSEAERGEAIEALGAFDFWARNQAKNPYGKCDFLSDAQKLLLQLLAAVERVSPGKKPCEIPDDLMGGLATYWTFESGVVPKQPTAVGPGQAP